MSHEEKISYVQQAMVHGCPSYFGLNENEVSQLAPDKLEIEFDCAKNWNGEE
ncbi:hypothetical protein AB6T85_00830 [Erwinia sp. ACCC 02193]|uniref:Uncharacterized protein n=1 Tax=Erwinia aeris TaxID=3239803 RepID=A0ABV4E265_9GAMM